MDTGMREFRVRRGLLKGEYIIYDSIKEFQDNNPGVEYKVYPDDIDNLEVGDWVQAEDGYILQLLHIKKPFLRGDNPNKVTQYFFCNSTPYATRGKKGVKTRKFYGQFAYPNNHRLSDGIVDIKINEALFMDMVLRGEPILKAYYLCLHKKQRPVNKIRATIEIFNIFRNKKIMEAFDNKLPTLLTELAKEFDEKWVKDQLKDLIDNSKKGTKDHRENLKFIMELQGMVTKGMIAQSPSQPKLPSKSQSEDASYEEIPNTPPPSPDEDE